MSLSDLKKSQSAKTKKKSFTVDEFISDAENYAKGTPEIVSEGKSSRHALEQAIHGPKKFDTRIKTKTSVNKSNKPYKHATFTLSEEAIDQLQQLASESRLAKSHIIRILIDELCCLEQNEKIKKLLDSNIS